MEDEAVGRKAERSTRPTAPPLAVAALVFGAVLVLVAQFVMDALAYTGEGWHWLQHGLIFVGGVYVGAAAAVLYLGGRHRT